MRWIILIFTLNSVNKPVLRSKKETDRLFQLSKPAREKAPVDDDLPPVDSHDEDDGSWSSDLGESDDNGDNDDEDAGLDDEDDEDLESSDSQAEASDSDSEKSYERKPRAHKESRDDKAGPERLPIKLPDGRIQKMGNLPSRPRQEDSDSDSGDDEEDREGTPPRTIEDVSTGARFGRAAVVDVITTKSRKGRIQAAKEQLAGICQEIIADPENSVRSST